MICHLLGVAAYFLDNPTTEKISFLYLCYNPNLVVIDDEEMRNKIANVYSEMCKECHSINHKELFEIAIRYLYTKKKRKYKDITEEQIKIMVDNFEFDLCDQSNYLSHLN